MPVCCLQCSPLDSLGFLPMPSKFSRHSLLFFTGQLHHRFTIDEIQGRNLRRDVWRVRMMGGGPRTYPGGVTKWEWKRLNEQKKLQLEEAKRIRDRQVFEYNQQRRLTSKAPEEMSHGPPQSDGQAFKSRRLDREHTHRRFPSSTVMESNLNFQTLPSSVSNAIDGRNPSLAPDDVRNSSHQLIPSSQRPWATSITEDTRMFSSLTVDGRLSGVDQLDDILVQNERIPSRSGTVHNANSEHSGDDPEGAIESTKEISEPSRLAQSRSSLLLLEGCLTMSRTHQVHSISQVTLNPDHKFVDTSGQEDEIHSMVKQQYTVVGQEKILSVIYSLLIQHIEKEPSYKVLVFCITASVTAFMAALFAKLGLNIREIHSRKSLAYRTRVSDEFRTSKGKIIMFTSNISARGVDYPDITFVLQVGLPSTREQYIHRLGRTGRSGKEGEGMLLLMPWEKPFLTKVKDLSIATTSFSEISKAEYQQICSVLSKMDNQLKEKAYQSWIGYYLSCALDLDMRTVVQLAAQFSTSMGLNEPPILLRSAIRKMRLSGVL